MSDPRLRVIERGEGSEQEVLGVLEGTTIAVRLPAGGPSLSQQMLALCLVDLLTRVFARISVEVDPKAPADPRLPPGPALLHDRFTALRANGTAPRDAGEPGITIAVGRGPSGDIHLDGLGWQSYIGSEPSRLCDGGDSADAVPIGALLAAARGAAHAFDLAMAPLGRSSNLPASIYSTALDYTHGSDPLGPADLPVAFRIDALQVGAGSLGGALDYALARCLQLAGDLAIVDPQQLEADNAYRAILAPRPAAEAEEEKAPLAARALGHTDLTVIGERIDLRGFISARDPGPLPLVLCAVDSAPARRAIQDCLPLWLLNGACNETEATVSAHHTGSGPCVYCLHLPKVMDAKAAKSRRIVSATGINYEMVIGLLTTKAPLEKNHLRVIEANAHLRSGALEDYLGSTLEELYDREFRYGAVQVRSADGGVVSVASPWVTALAGFLLAAETLKQGGGDAYDPYRLGFRGHLGIKLEESVYGSPEHVLLTEPARWADHRCLCRSARRRGLILARYGLAEADYEL